MATAKEGIGRSVGSDDEDVAFFAAVGRERVSERDGWNSWTDRRSD